MTQLTDREQELLARYLRYYERLNKGIVIPRTKLQHQFVEVCRGRLQPSTEHEIAYQKHLAILDREWAIRTGSPQYVASPSATMKSAKALTRTVSKKPRRVIEVRETKKGILTESERRNIAKYGPQPWKKTVVEPLGSRDDFKKDSGANWSHVRKPKF